MTNLLVPIRLLTFVSGVEVAIGYRLKPVQVVVYPDQLMPKCREKPAQITYFCEIIVLFSFLR